MDLRWNKREHSKSWIEKKPVEIVDVSCQVEQQEEKGEYNYLQKLTITLLMKMTMVSTVVLKMTLVRRIVMKMTGR